MSVPDQGISPSRYTIIPRTLIFLFSGKKVLLLRGAKEKRIWGYRLNGVGGHIERGETVITAARRELLEETGLQVEKLVFCGTVMVHGEQSIGVGLFIFKAETTEEINLTHTEEGALEWHEIDSLPQVELVEDLPVLIPLVFAHQAGSPPFFARSYYDEDEKLHVVID